MRNRDSALGPREFLNAVWNVNHGIGKDLPKLVAVLLRSVAARLDSLNKRRVENRFRLQRRKLGIGPREDGIDLLQAFRFGSEIAAVSCEHCVVADFRVFDSVQP